MKLRKTIKWMLKLLLLIILVAGAIASAISTIWTIIPDSLASKESMLGYKSHCSFAPISTIILILIAVVFSYILFRTKFLKFIK
jgi:ABC-type sulfate transport system permease component